MRQHANISQQLTTLSQVIVTFWMFSTPAWTGFVVTSLKENDRPVWVMDVLRDVGGDCWGNLRDGKDVRWPLCSNRASRSYPEFYPFTLHLLLEIRKGRRFSAQTPRCSWRYGWTLSWLGCLGLIWSVSRCFIKLPLVSFATCQSAHCSNVM